MEGNNNTFIRRALVLSLIILGWVLCGYLAFRSTQLKGNPGIVPDLCQTIFGSSCDKALTNPVSWHLGYPLAGWGLAYFGLLGLLFSLAKPFADRIVILAAAFGVGAGGVQSAVLLRFGPPCPLCMSIHIVGLLTLIVLFTGIRGPISFKGQGKATAKYRIMQWGALLLTTVIIGGIAEVGVLKTSIGKKVPLNMEDVSKKFEAETVYNIPPSNTSSRIGSPNAPVQLVVFSSFQCPACKAFAPSLEKLHEKFGDKVSIIFKNFPLSTTCNPRISEDMQPQACQAAFAAIAAQRQNRFWNYHDQLFQSDLQEDDQTLVSMAQNIGLDMEKWESDRQSEETKAMLAEDVKIAYELGINATPTVFINGRKVSSFQEPALTFLIEHELKKDSD